MARFRREAQVLASLNHPNIAAIHGIEEDGGTHFLVLELIGGETLEQRIARGALPWREAAEIARQIAEAVEAAHDRGVIHRDLKPANVKLTEDGAVKVLDFGLAKALSAPEAESGSPMSSPTLATHISDVLTEAHVILGTAAYMSPEQARGRPVDRRCDSWSFGVLLFEMLTGRRLFAGETVSDTLASVLKSEPDWSELPQDVPARLGELLERCLAKEPQQRLKDLGDARLALDWVLEGRDASSGEEAPARGRRPLALASLLVAVALLAGAAGAWLRGPASDSAAAGEAAGPARLTALWPEELVVRDFQISPDGRTLAADTRFVTLRSLDGYEVRRVELPTPHANSCFSPDGRWLAVVAPEQPDSTRFVLWKVAVAGDAPPLELFEWQDGWVGLHWLPDGDLVTASTAGVVRLPTDGRPPAPPIPVRAEGFDLEDNLPPRALHRARLPDGRRLLVTTEIWDEAGYSQGVVTLDTVTGEARLVLKDGARPLWSDSGHLLISRGTTILAVPFDPERLEVTGGPVAVEEGLRTSASWAHGEFDLSNDGTLVYQPGGFVGGRRRLVWLDERLRELEPWSPGELAMERGPLTSLDGRRIAVVFAGPDGVYDIWLGDPERRLLQRWLERPNEDCVPSAWSHDGSLLAYMARTARESRHFLRRLEDGEDVLLLEDREAAAAYFAGSFTDDGRGLLFTRASSGASGSGWSLLLLELDADGRPVGEPRELLQGSGWPSISPDGRWLSYVSEASGRRAAYLRRWLGDGRLGPEMQATGEGISSARWSARTWWRPALDGNRQELRHLQGGQVMAVAVPEGEGAPGRPRVVGEWTRRHGSMSLLADGRILATLDGEREALPRELQVVRGWTSELARRLATD